MIPDCIRSRVAFVAIRHYAALSYLYYEEDFSAVEDHDFDALCKWLLDNYSWVKPHDINGYLSKSSLRAGTGFDIASKVCGQTRDFAVYLKTGKLPALSPETKNKKQKAEEDFSDLA